MKNYLKFKHVKTTLKVWKSLDRQWVKYLIEHWWEIEDGSDPVPYTIPNSKQARATERMLYILSKNLSLKQYKDSLLYKKNTDILLS